MKNKNMYVFHRKALLVLGFFATLLVLGSQIACIPDTQISFSYPPETQNKSEIKRIRFQWKEGSQNVSDLVEGTLPTWDSTTPSNWVFPVINCSKLSTIPASLYIEAHALSSEDKAPLFVGRSSLRAMCAQNAQHFFMAPPGRVSKWPLFKSVKEPINHLLGHTWTALSDGLYLLAGGTQKWTLGGKKLIHIDAPSDALYIYNSTSGMTHKLGLSLQYKRAFHNTVFAQQQIHISGGLDTHDKLVAQSEHFQIVAGNTQIPDGVECSSLYPGSQHKICRMDGSKDTTSMSTAFQLRVSVPSAAQDSNSSSTKTFFVGGLRNASSSHPKDLDQTSLPQLILHQASYVKESQSILVTGGYYYDKEHKRLRATNFVYEVPVSSAANTSIAIRPLMRAPRAGHTATALQDGRSVLLIGGTAGSILSQDVAVSSSSTTLFDAELLTYVQHKGKKQWIQGQLEWDSSELNKKYTQYDILRNTLHTAVALPNTVQGCNVNSKTEKAVGAILLSGGIRKCIQKDQDRSICVPRQHHVVVCVVRDLRKPNEHRFKLRIVSMEKIQKGLQQKNPETTLNFEHAPLFQTSAQLSTEQIAWVGGARAHLQTDSHGLSQYIFTAIPAKDGRLYQPNTFDHSLYPKEPPVYPFIKPPVSRNLIQTATLSCRSDAPDVDAVCDEIHVSSKQAGTYKTHSILSDTQNHVTYHIGTFTGEVNFCTQRDGKPLIRTSHQILRKPHNNSDMHQAVFVIRYHPNKECEWIASYGPVDPQQPIHGALHENKGQIILTISSTGRGLQAAKLFDPQITGWFTKTKKDPESLSFSLFTQLYVEPTAQLKSVRHSLLGKVWATERDKSTWLLRSTFTQKMVVSAQQDFIFLFRYMDSEDGELDVVWSIGGQNDREGVLFIAHRTSPQKGSKRDNVYYGKIHDIAVSPEAKYLIVAGELSAVRGVSKEWNTLDNPCATLFHIEFTSRQNRNKRFIQSLFNTCRQDHKGSAFERVFISKKPQAQDYTVHLFGTNSNPAFKLVSTYGTASETSPRPSPRSFPVGSIQQRNPKSKMLLSLVYQEVDASRSYGLLKTGTGKNPLVPPAWTEFEPKQGQSKFKLHSVQSMEGTRFHALFEIQGTWSFSGLGASNPVLEGASGTTYNLYVEWELDGKEKRFSVEQSFYFPSETSRMSIAMGLQSTADLTLDKIILVGQVQYKPGAIQNETRACRIEVVDQKESKEELKEGKLNFHWELEKAGNLCKPPPSTP